MTVIKFNPTKETFYFVHEVGRDPITKKRKQIRRTGFKNIREASKSLKKVIIETEKLKYPHKEITFEEFSSQWVEIKKISIQHSTYVNTVQNFRNNVYPYIGKYKLHEIDNNILQNYILELSKKVTRLGKTISPYTVHRIWKHTKEVFMRASKQGLFNEDELNGLYLPILEKKIIVWNEEDMFIFLKASEKIAALPRSYTAMTISLLTGMRQSEVLGLTWKNISFANKTITINQALVLDSGTSTYKIKQRNKTKTSRATISVSDALIEILKKHKLKIEMEKEVSSKKYKDNDLVICTKNGKPLSPQNLRKEFNILIDKLNLPKIRFHDLRHTHATFLISKGVSPKIVQEILRHANIKTTLDTYIHSFPPNHKEAVSNFDKLLKMNESLLSEDSL